MPGSCSGCSPDWCQGNPRQECHPQRIYSLCIAFRSTRRVRLTLEEEDCVPKCLWVDVIMAEGGPDERTPLIPGGDSIGGDVHIGWDDHLVDILACSVMKTPRYILSSGARLLSFPVLVSPVIDWYRSEGGPLLNPRNSQWLDRSTGPDLSRLMTNFLCLIRAT